MERITLGALSVNKFRNISKLKINPGKRFNVISGRNGSGKTNVMEAIYFLSALRSFRTTYRREIIQKGETQAKLKGVFKGAANGMVEEIELSYQARKIRKDGKELVSMVEHFSELPMVLFHPANMSLIQGGPRERRRFLDRALFQAEKAYPSIAQDYQKALESRNRLLKSDFRDTKIAGPYELQLATLGAKIIESRRRFVEKIDGLFSEAFEKISLGIRGRVTYRPDVDGGEEEIKKALEDGFDRDKKRGFTERGPHSDELEVKIEDLVARRFASQGQQRLAVLSMKIAETIALQNVTSRVPIMLLDDISSELDRERNRELFEFLRRVDGQVFITTTHLDHVMVEEERTDFKIKNGELV